MADSAYAQIEMVLRTVLVSPAFQNGSGPFTRTLHVTDKIKDIKVSRLTVEVHPEWAVELGPIEAVTRIKKSCLLYDERHAEARERALQDLRQRLFGLAELIRSSGGEHLFDEVRHAPVAHSRSLVKFEWSHLPVPKHRSLRIYGQ